MSKVWPERAFAKANDSALSEADWTVVGITEYFQ